MGKMIFIGDTFITTTKCISFIPHFIFMMFLLTQEAWDRYKAAYDATPSVACMNSQDSIEQ